MRPCQKITKQLLPAVRMSLAIELSRRGMTEQEIAKGLGIAQATISKYLTGNVSKSISELCKEISEKEQIGEIADKITKGENAEKEIDALCENLAGMHASQY